MGSWRFAKGLIRSRRKSRCPPWPPAVVPRGLPLSPVRYLLHLRPVHLTPCAIYSTYDPSTQFRLRFCYT
eukprot:5852194-Heterocapsa_arctica.AAC.1